MITSIFVVPVFGLKILNSTMVKDENGYVHLIGEAENNEVHPIDKIYVTGTLINNNNTNIGNFSNQVEIHPLNHLEITPFDILIYDKSKNDMIKKYEINFKFNASSNEILKDLTIGSVSSRLDITGFYFITGRVTSNMNSLSNHTVIVASVKDKDDNLLGIWKAQTEPYNIPPYGSASFTIPITDKDQSFKIHNYTLYINNIQLIRS
jgi:hypothetical protein